MASHCVRAGGLSPALCGQLNSGITTARLSGNTMNQGYQLGRDVQLPFATAVWVLGAHLYAILVPVMLIVVLVRHWPAVVENTDYPAMLFVAAGLMMAGSAFEVAQNAVDQWYLTPETGCAEGTGFCDFLFYWFIVASQAAVAVASMGDSMWIVLGAVAGTCIFPFLYFRQVAHFAPLGALGLLSVLTAWWRFGDPVILLQLLLSPLTMYFFACLLKTGNQVLHGFTTVAASSGVVFLAWGIHGGSQGTPWSWTTVIVVFAAGLSLAAIIRPLLLRLPATPRTL